LVEPELLALFIKEPIYVLPQDRPQVASQPSEPSQAHTATLINKAEKPLPIGPPERADSTKPGVALPIILPKSLVLLVHHPDGKLPADQEAMIGKLALATEADTSLHHTLTGDMSTYPWPTAWNPWPARLTLLLGWPEGLLAKHRVSGHFQVLKFGATKVLAGPHPGQLEADKSLKAQLWAAIQAAK
jgi:hypothetical protein